MTKNFQKKVEDFVCDNCSSVIKGSGYTNHCPKCLWSKHVDINPGDRSADCGGLMRPMGLIIQGRKELIIHRCQKCNQEKTNSTSPNDNRKLIIKISTRPLIIHKQKFLQ